MVLARPYHMDTGIGHEIEAEIQATVIRSSGCNIMPIDADLLDWVFEAEEVQEESRARSDIPTCGLRPTAATRTKSCGARSLRRASRGSLACCGSPATNAAWTADLHPGAENCGGRRHAFLKFGDLDSTKPAGRIRFESRPSPLFGEYSAQIIQRKLSYLSPECPLAQPGGCQQAEILTRGPRPYPST